MAGLMYGIFGISISVASLISGFMADLLGTRTSICISSAIGFSSRVAMAYAVLGQEAWLSIVILLFLVAPSIALMGPPIPTAIKRYTTKRTLNISFTLYYGASFCSNFLSKSLVSLLIRLLFNFSFFPLSLLF